MFSLTIFLEKPNKYPYRNDIAGYMFGYNNLTGFRRNIPKYQVEPPTMFAMDPKPLAKQVSKIDDIESLNEKSLDTFKSSSWIGYPFWQNDYREFYPSI